MKSEIIKTININTKALITPVTPELHETIRKISYEKRISQANIVREALAQWIAKNK